MKQVGKGWNGTKDIQVDLNLIFEEHVVTQEKWHRSYSRQTTLRLGLSEPPCGQEFNL